MKTSIDKFGRIVIPKGIREDLGLTPGTILRIEADEQILLLKPVHEESPIINKGGVFVYAGAKTGDIAGSNRMHRVKRSRKGSERRTR